MRLLRFFGWLVIPYIMLLFRWRRLNKAGRLFGVVWTLFFAFAIALSTVQNAQSPVATSAGSENTVITNSISSNTSALDSSNSINTSSQSNVNKTQSTATVAKKVQPMFVQVGKPGVVGPLQITVNNLQEVKSVGSDGIGSTANGIYWVIQVTVANEDKAPRLVDASLFHIQEDNGNLYDTDTAANMYANANDDLFLHTLNPGVSMTGYIVFDMPNAPTYGHIGEHYTLIVKSGLLSTKQNTFALP